MTRARNLADLGADATGLATDAEVTSAIASKIDGDGSITDVVEVTQAAYDALTPDANTLYVIVG